MLKFKKVVYLIMLTLAVFNAVPVYALDLASDFFSTKELVVEEDIFIKEEVGEEVVLDEVIEKRESNKKYFRTSHGNTMVAIYPMEVHYNEGGKYKDIDNTLYEKDGVLKNRANDFEVSFEKTSKASKSSKIFTIEKSDGTLGLSLINSRASTGRLEEVDLTLKSKSLIKDFLIMGAFQKISEKDLSNKKLEVDNTDSKIEYKSILSNIDIKYDVLSNKVKESIILKNKSVNNILEFNLNLSEGLTPVLLKDKSIEIRNKDSVVYIIESPYMVDSKREFSEGIKVDLIDNKGSYLLRLTIDREWLNDERREYPVIVDPTVVTKANAANISDTYIHAGDDSYSSSLRTYDDVMRIGPSASNVARGLIKFDLPNNLQSGDKVVNAVFTVTNYPQHMQGLAYPSGEVEIDVHQMKTAWESATAYWNNLSGTSNYDTRVADYIMYKYSTTAFYSWDFDITRIVKDWYLNNNNYGLLLKEPVETLNANRGQPRFFSSDYQSGPFGASPIAVMPTITITYRNQTGLEDYQTYSSHGIGNTVVHTNNFNGNLVLTHQDASTLGMLLPVSVYHVYNANDKDVNIGYGYGYRLNLNQTIVEKTVGSTVYLEYVDEDGTKHYFPKTTSPYKDEDGLGLSITYNSINLEYTMKDKGGNQSVFVKSGSKWYLKSIKNTSGKMITIGFNGSNYNQIATVTDGAGDVITLTYASNLLSKISDVASRVTTYTYTSSMLSGIKYPDNKTIAYTYNGSRLLTKVTGIDGSYGFYTYTAKAPFRVLTMSEYGSNGTIGNKLTLTYGENTTKITDNKNNVNNYVFNNWGQSTSITDLGKSSGVNDAYGVNYKYSNSTGNENKLILSGKLLKSTNNYIINSSFENNLTDWSISQGGTVNGTVSAVTNEKNIGGKSAKLVSTSVEAYPRIFQDASTLVNGKSYTVSGYMKGSVTEKKNVNASGVIMYVAYQKADGAYYSINYYPEITNDWERYSFTFTMPSDATGIRSVAFALRNAKGTVYFDNVQLEEGELTNPYNLVDNGGFHRGDAGWGKNSGITTSDLVGSVDGSNAWKMVGSATQYKNIYQTIPVNGKKGDVLNVGFWVKSGGVPIYGVRHTGIIIYYLNSAGTKVGDAVIDANPDSSVWQYVSESLTVPVDYASLRVHVVHNMERGTAYFDNVGVYKDEFATSVVYDANGNITSFTNKDKQNNSFVYDKRDELISSTSNRGRKTINEYQYNVQNRLLKTISPNGVTSSYTYDSNGNVTEVKTVESNQVNTIDTAKTYYIKSWGTNLYVGVNGNVSSNNSNVELIAKGEKAEWVFIPKGSNYEIRPRLSTTTRMDVSGASQANNANIQVYVSNNNIAQQFKLVKNEDGTYYIKTALTSFAKCVDISAAEIYTMGRNVQQYGCNEATVSPMAQKFVLEEVNPQNLKYIQTNNGYSSDGRYNTSTTNQRGKTTTSNYNLSTGTVASVVDVNDNITSYSYDIMNKITSVSGGNNGNTINSYTYVNDYLTTINHNNFSYSFLYDQYGNTTNIKVGNQLLITNSYAVNNGNLTSSTYGNGQVVSYAYDNYNRVSRKTNTTGTLDYFYDNRGNVGKVVSKNVSGTLLSTVYGSYDISDRLTKYHEDRGSNKYSIKYTYDGYSNVSSKEYNLNSISKTRSFIYDIDNKITKIGSSTYTYDMLDRLSTRKINNSYTTTYNYLDLNIDSNRTTTIIESIENGSDKISYGYDVLGNIATIKENSVLINEYEYDSLNQLIVDNDYKHNKKYEYIYDNFGNILTKVEKNLGTDVIIKTDTYSYSNNNWKDQLTSFNNKVITYDQIGNPASYDGYTYTWVNGRQLQSISNGRNTYSYKYNDSGIRTEKVVNNQTTKYFLEGTDIIYEDRNGSLIYYTYDSAGVSGFEYNNNVYYFIKNIQGDVTGILDSSYNRIVSYVYDSWGNPISIEDGQGNDVSNNSSHIANVNPFRYRSYYFDVETGMYYLNSRYYNPSWGRFLNSDSLVSGVGGQILGYNVYQYTFNNPNNLKDEDGYWPNLEGIKNRVVGAANAFVGTVKEVYYGTKSVVSSLVEKTPIVNYVQAIIGVDYNGNRLNLTQRKAKANVGFNISVNALLSCYMMTSINVVGQSPLAPVMINGNYMKKNSIDAHAFKGEFVPLRQISKFDVFRDKTNNSLWLGNKNQTVWHPTNYFLSDLIEIFKK